MRRRRSETINAESYEEFLRLSQLPKPTSGARHSLPEPFLLSEAFIQNVLNIPIKTCEPSPKNQKVKSKAATIASSYWDDIDFSADDVSTPATTTCSTMSNHKGSMEEDEFDELEPVEIQVKHAKIMVVGAQDTGRHRLVNSLFGLPDCQEYEIAHSLDLIVNKLTTENTSTNYKFWIKDALCQKFKHLFKVYHKSVSLFVFVYQVNNKTSFECLTQSIEQIQREVGYEHFKGILIGGSPSTRDQSSRQVSTQEAEELKNSFGLSAFCEMDFTHNQEYLERIQTLLQN